MKFLVTLVIIISIKSSIFCAISHDASTTSRAKESRTYSFSHSCSGSDRILIVAVASKQGSVTWIKYNGTQLSKLGGVTKADARAELWYLVNPATGSNTVQIKMNSKRTFAVGANSYTGVDQTTPFFSSGTATGKSSTSSISVTSLAGHLVVDALATKEADPTVGAGQTQRTERRSEESTYHSTSDEAGVAGNVTMSYTHSSKDWAIVAGSMQPSIALPVELSNFKVLSISDKPMLKWSTESEVNNSHFVIERSIDGKYFDKIGEINGSGNSNKRIDYEFMDTDSKGYNSYYRLKQIDFNGKENYSIIIRYSISSIPFNTPININGVIKSDGELSYKIEGLKPKIQYQMIIRNMNGELIASSSIYGRQKVFSLSDLGLRFGISNQEYILQLVKDNSVIISKLILIQ